MTIPQAQPASASPVRGSDSHEFVELVARLDAATTCEEFGAAALAAGRLIGGSVTTFDEVDVVRASVGCASTDPAFETRQAVLDRIAWVDQHPVVQHDGLHAGAPPRAISGVVTRKAYRDARFYLEHYGPLGVEDELVIRFAGTCGVGTLQVARAAWGFSRADLEIAAEIQRVLTVMARVRRDRETVRVGEPVVRDMAEGSGRGVLVAGADGEVRNLDGSPASVQDPLLSAIRSAVAVAAVSPRDGSVVPGAALIEMHVPSARGVALSVRVLRPPEGCSLFPVVIERPPVGVSNSELRAHGLTGRQAEVMALILEGATNGGVANELGISERTVEKHVLGAYAKLGARTRTEALLKVLR